MADRKKLTNGSYLEAFGLDKLLTETLKKCKPALKGEMRTVMADNIGLYILIELMTLFLMKRCLSLIPFPICF